MKKSNPRCDAHGITVGVKANPTSFSFNLPPYPDLFSLVCHLKILPFEISLFLP